MWAELRIKVIQAPPIPCIDGIRLDYFVPGLRYEVGTVLGSYLLAEGWAEPIEDDQNVLLSPLSGFDQEWDDDPLPPNLHRETYPPYYDGPPALAMDRRRRSRFR